MQVLATGYAAERVAGTVTLIRDADVTIVVDPWLEVSLSPGLLAASAGRRVR